MQSLKVKSRRVRFWWNLTFAYIARYKLWILTTLVLTSVVTYSLINLWPKIARSNVVTLGYVGTYTLETIPTQILTLATQSLIAADTSGKPQASLASHWTVSDDGKTYIVFLKDNLTWHDSTKIDAKDISIAISQVEITALNNKAIEFKLPNPIASFPLALDKPVFKAKSFYGTGQFRIVDIDQVDDVVKKISLLPKDKNLPKVEINFYQNEQQATNALKIGEIKSASISNVANFENWPNIEIEKQLDESEVVTVFYNNNDLDLSSKELRQSLSYAINKSPFPGNSADGPVSPASWAHNGSVKKYEYSEAKAKELLSKLENKGPQITLTVVPGLEPVAEQIKKDWEAIGIKTAIKVEKVIPKDFQALLAVNKIKADPDQYALWHSTQKQTNITGYQDVRIDKLLEDARVTQDEARRKELYIDFQRFLVEDAPAAFLYHPYKYQVTYKNAKNFLTKLPN